MSSSSSSSSSSRLNEIPEEIQESLENFDSALGEMEDLLGVQFSVPHSKLAERLTPMERAKLDLANAYALNSIFFQYLNTRGVSIKDHPLKSELARIKICMDRVKEVEEKKKAPRLDKEAAKRFVRSSLWQQAQSKSHKTERGVDDADESSPAKKTKL